MVLEFLYRRFEQAGVKPAFWSSGKEKTYAELRGSITQACRVVSEATLGSGAVVLLQGQSTPTLIETFLALIESRCIVVPISDGLETTEVERVSRIVQAQAWIGVDPDGSANIRKMKPVQEHGLIQQLRDAKVPGLVLLTTGSTGEPKAAVHDLSRLLKKYHTLRRDFRTLAFLQLDHIGGVDTLFYCLSNLSTIVLPGGRSPEEVCAAVEGGKAEVLPVTPSFLNLLFLSEAHLRFDLSSLRIITYGAEVMPRQTLDKCLSVFPGVEMVQKFGTTEVGTLRSQSESKDSLWVKVGGEGYETRIVDGLLQIRAENSMLGYLNAPSPFTSDGWFVTGDRVECKGDYLRFLGREAEVINVGGQKVDPVEVEEAIRGSLNIADVVVFGEANPMLGQIVCARVQLIEPEDELEVTRRLQEALRGRLERHKIPVRIEAGTKPVPTHRFKKMRRPGPGQR